MNSLTAEELELLNDPELVSLRAGIATEREAAVKAEAAEHDRQAALDAAMLGEYVSLVDKKRVHKEWADTWQTFTEEEALLLSKMRSVCERLLWVEDDEEEARDKVGEVYGKSLADLKALETEKRRWLEDSACWQHEYDKQYQQQWAADRARVAEEQHVYLTAKSQATLEEEEIEALKQRVKRLHQHNLPLATSLICTPFSRATCKSTAATIMQSASSDYNRMDPQVIYLDVGQGDCTVIRIPQGAAAGTNAGAPSRMLTIVVDAGYGKGGLPVESMERAMGPDTVIDLLVITHADDDHVNGIVALLQYFTVLKCWVGYSDDGIVETFKGNIDAMGRALSLMAGNLALLDDTPAAVKALLGLDTFRAAVPINDPALKKRVDDALGNPIGAEKAATLANTALLAQAWTAVRTDPTLGPSVASWLLAAANQLIAAGKAVKRARDQQEAARSSGKQKELKEAQISVEAALKNISGVGPVMKMAASVIVTRAYAGAKASIGPCYEYVFNFDVLDVPPLASGRGEDDKNNASVISCLTVTHNAVNDVKMRQQFLFCGDAEDKLEYKMVGADNKGLIPTGNAPTPLSVRLKETTVYKLSHHGSHKSSTACLLDVMKDSLQLITVSAHTKGNNFGHPRFEVFLRLQDLAFPHIDAGPVSEYPYALWQSTNWSKAEWTPYQVSNVRANGLAPKADIDLSDLVVTTVLGLDAIGIALSCSKLACECIPAVCAGQAFLGKLEFDMPYDLADLLGQVNAVQQHVEAAQSAIDDKCVEVETYSSGPMPARTAAICDQLFALQEAIALQLLGPLKDLVESIKHIQNAFDAPPVNAERKKSLMWETDDSVYLMRQGIDGMCAMSVKLMSLATESVQTVCNVILKTFVAGHSANGSVPDFVQKAVTDARQKSYLCYGSVVKYEHLCASFALATWSPILGEKSDTSAAEFAVETALGEVAKARAEVNFSSYVAPCQATLNAAVAANQSAEAFACALSSVSCAVALSGSTAALATMAMQGIIAKVTDPNRSPEAEKLKMGGGKKTALPTFGWTTTTAEVNAAMQSLTEADRVVDQLLVAFPFKEPRIQARALSHAQPPSGTGGHNTGVPNIPAQNRHASPHNLVSTAIPALCTMGGDITVRLGFDMAAGAMVLNVSQYRVSGIETHRQKCTIKRK